MLLRDNPTVDSKEVSRDGNATLRIANAGARNGISANIVFHLLFWIWIFDYLDISHVRNELSCLFILRISIYWFIIRHIPNSVISLIGFVVGLISKLK